LSRSTSRSVDPRNAALPEPQPQRRLSLLLQIFGAHQRMAELVNRELSRDGVDASGYATLSSIGAFGPLRLTELAGLLGTPLTTMSDWVRRLEAAGKVQRRPNPADARSTLLELTATGDAEWRAGWPALGRATTAIVAGLADEPATRAALDELAQALEAALQNSPKP
jgi:DNA-binding MarR family transcriptional regulator